MIHAIVCGCRTYHNKKELYRSLDNIFSYKGSVEIVSGGAQGTDLLAEKYTKEHGLPLKRFPANWAEYGKAAGPIRNKEMLEYIKDTEEPLVIAFWDGVSSGTGNMVDMAIKNQICTVINYI